MNKAARIAAYEAKLERAREARDRAARSPDMLKSYAAGNRDPKVCARRVLNGWTDPRTGINWANGVPGTKTDNPATNFTSDTHGTGLDVRSMSPESVESYLDSLGVSGAASGFAPLQVGPAPRTTVDPNIAEMARVRSAERAATRAAYFAGLPKLDMRTASPDAVATRLRAMGVSTDGVTFTPVPPIPSTTQPVKPVDAETLRAEMERKAQRKIRRLLSNARIENRPVDTRSLSNLEFRIYRQLRGLDGGGYGQPR